MPLLPLAGHEVARDRVRRAMSAGRLPQMILITGPRGVGKQRLALWIAQMVLCQAADPRPCDRCAACRQVLGLAHPDLHWLFPVPRPKAPEADRQVEELADTLATALAERREKPLYPAADGMAGHFVATARLLQRRAALTPAVGPRKVFVVAEADRLVPQESSPEAANALLKLLEEPPADSQFLLTVTDPSALLPTIRSRLVPLRLTRLADAEVSRFLETHTTFSPEERRERVAYAAGSIGVALAMGEERSRAEQAAGELFRALEAGPGPRMERAMKQGPWQARGEFTAMLDVLADTLSASIRAGSGTVVRRSLPALLRRPRPLEALLAAQARVSAAREAAQGNVNPQLLLAVLAEDLAEVL